MKLFIAVIGFLFCLNQAQALGAEHAIAVGQSLVLPMTSSGAVRVKGRNIIAIEDLGNQIKILGKSAGQATISHGLTHHQIFVVEGRDLDFFADLKKLISTFMGLKVGQQGGRTVVSGELLRVSDWQEIAELAAIHGAPYRMQVKMDKQTESELRLWLESRFADEKLNLPSFVFTPHAQALISTEQKDLSTLWNQTLQPLGIEAVYEKSQIAVETLVRVRIVVAEVNKRIQTQLGIEWPEVIAASITPKLKGPDQLQVFLKAIERDGLGQILASPNLLARSGSEADFLAGGEFGIKVTSNRSKEVIWKKHGIYLKMKPRADRSGRMSVELTTEVSLIDGSQTVDGIPGLKTNRITTHFDMTRPRTIVLSGLIRNDWGEDRSGISGLASLPILGKLFRSDGFFQNKTELVIFVTPEIVSDQSASELSLYPKDWSPK